MVGVTTNEVGETRLALQINLEGRLQRSLMSGNGF